MAFLLRLFHDNDDHRKNLYLIYASYVLNMYTLIFKKVKIVF